MAMHGRLLAATAAFCFSVSVLAAANTVHPELPQIKRVYLLPMTSGLDQYLANRLAKAGRFEVVTDPAMADAVFTDRLGPAFEDKWTELYPPPPAKTEQPAAASGAATGTTGKEESTAAVQDFSAAPIARVSSFSRGKGNVFLVSRKSRAVLWSHYRQPKSTRSLAMDQTADRIAGELHDALKVKR